MDTDRRFRNLRSWNIAMAIFHAVQGVIMLVVSSDFSLPLNTDYLTFHVETSTLAPLRENIGSLHIGPLVAGFLFLSSLAHIAVSVPAGFRWYRDRLNRGMNPARWIEYSFSSSLMIFVIAMLVGVYDLSALILLFALNAMMILFGWIMELHNQTTQKTDWTSYWFGCLAGAIPWVVIALYLFNAGEGEYRAPTFVYWIYFSIFLFFNIFAVNMALQYKRLGKWRDYLFGEKTYLILSLVAKSLLAWQVFAGTLRPA